VGYRIFSLELHVPYFRLRYFATPKDEIEDVSHSARRQEIDVSFLNLLRPTRERGKHELYEAQFSLCIVGSDHKTWVAYAFDSPEDGKEIDEDEDEIQEDRVVGDCLHYSEEPILDPRAYFLHVMSNRLTSICREWMCVVRMIENSVQRVFRLDHRTRWLTEDIADICVSSSRSR
jgi:hypothetical protein